MERDVNEGFSEIENGVFSVCNWMYPSAQRLPAESEQFSILQGFTNVQTKVNREKIEKIEPVY